MCKIHVTAFDFQEACCAVVVQQHFGRSASQTFWHRQPAPSAWPSLCLSGLEPGLTECQRPYRPMLPPYSSVYRLRTIPAARECRLAGIPWLHTSIRDAKTVRHVHNSSASARRNVPARTVQILPKHQHQSWQCRVSAEVRLHQLMQRERLGRAHFQKPRHTQAAQEGSP